MMRGKVSGNGIPSLPLDLVDANGRVVPIDAVVDTGFTDCLSLPRELAAALGWAEGMPAVSAFADGHTESVPTVVGVALWHGAEVEFRAHLLPGEPLLGMSMLHGSTLFVQAREGGEVVVAEDDAGEA